MINYGTQGNDQLLQSYGFVEPGNTADRYVMTRLGQWVMEGTTVGNTDLEISLKVMQDKFNKVSNAVGPAESSHTTKALFRVK